MRTAAHDTELVVLDPLDKCYGRVEAMQSTFFTWFSVDDGERSSFALWKKRQLINACSPRRHLIFKNEESRADADLIIRWQNLSHLSRHRLYTVRIAL